MAKISTFTTHVAGVSYRREQVSKCYEGQPVTLIREPSNPHDKNAIRVYAGGGQLGFISRDEAKTMAPFIDRGGQGLNYHT